VVRGMRVAPKRVGQSVSPETIATEIERLSGLPPKELKAAWAAEFRRDSPKGLWRDLLLRTLAWQIQEKAFGGHDRATLRLLQAYGQKRPGDQRCQWLKAGTVLVREFAGTRHTVTIAPEGFLLRERLSPACLPSPGSLAALIGMGLGFLALGNPQPKKDDWEMKLFCRSARRPETSIWLASKEIEQRAREGESACDSGVDS
jgi:hypothetical protein